MYLGKLLVREDFYIILPGEMTCPGGFLMTRSRPSSCFSTNWKPQRASVMPTLYVQWRSESLRVNVSCSFCCRTIITSPVSVFGCQENRYIYIYIFKSLGRLFIYHLYTEKTPPPPPPTQIILICTDMASLRKL